MGHRTISDIITVIFFLLVISQAAAVAGDSPVQAGDNLTQKQPAPSYTIRLFIPSGHMIHSSQVTDQINSPGGDVIIATSFGLSTYNGTWSTRHINLQNISAGLMDDYITAVELDPDGNLWIGNSGGLQIYNGVYYKVIRDQQLLKETRILDLQRWNNDMWIATGHAGIHRYHEGTWTWYQPMVEGGAGFYEVNSMALDTSSNSLLIATTNEGLWIVTSPVDPVRFDLLAGKDGTFGLLEQVKKDPLGGVYFFNASTVIHYDTTRGFTPVLNIIDLTPVKSTFNDIAADSDGTLYLATDNGIYIWRDGSVYRYLGRFEGIGTSAIVQTINVDAQHRAWFATQEEVGYYQDSIEPGSLLIFESATPTTVQTVLPVVNISESPPTFPPGKAVIQTSITPVASNASSGIFSPIIDPLARALNAILSVLGLSFGS
jgi:ligand-binding sensor domain-containing protein